MKTLVHATWIVAALGTAAHANAPAWCSAEGVKKTGNPYNITESLARTEESAISDLISLTCWPEAEAQKRKPEIDAARAAWSKRMLMEDADWADAAIYFSLQNWQRDAAWGQQDAKVPYSQQSPMEQYYWLGSEQDLDIHYLTDAFGARLSETGRFRYILNCLDTSVAGSWAMCHGDIAVFDRAKLAAEIRTDKITTPLRRMRIRLELAKLDRRLAQRKTDIAALIAKDGEYAKLFSIAETVRTEWTARWKSEAALLDLVLAMDEARITKSRKASAGCDAKTFPALQRAISAFPAERFAQKPESTHEFVKQVAATLVFDPNGYLASTAYYLCTTLEEKPDTITYTLGDAMQRYAGHRGPRNATIVRIRAANIVLDDRKASIQYPETFRRWLGGSSGGSYGHSVGVVASLATAGDQITITFPKEPAKTKVCSKSKQTNRVVQIRSDGSLVYEQVCTAYTMEAYDTSPRPQTVNARYATGVKKGAVVEAGNALVLRVWPNANATAPSHVFGAPVK